MSIKDSLTNHRNFIDLPRTLYEQFHLGIGAQASSSSLGADSEGRGAEAALEFPDCYNSFMTKANVVSIPRNTSLLSVSSIAPTLRYEEDVFPKLPDSETPLKRSTVGNELLSPTCAFTPVKGNSKQRKLSALESWEKLGTYMGRKGTKGCVQLDVLLVRPSLSCKGEEICRAELCCKDADGKRVYVFGSTEKKYGSELRTHCQSSETTSQLIQVSPRAKC